MRITSKRRCGGATDSAALLKEQRSYGAMPLTVLTAASGNRQIAKRDGAAYRLPPLSSTPVAVPLNTELG